MRLVCPNCDAEYEVDAAAIPRTGRDVQCSNCGHAWFQAHPDMVDDAAEDLTPQSVPFGAEERLAEDDTALAAGLTEAPGMSAMPDPAPRPKDDALAAANGFAQAPAPLSGRMPVQPAASARGPAPAPAGTQPVAPPLVESAAATRNIDDSVLAVLREEAAREVAARRAEAPAPALETQTEMRLAPAASASTASQVVARLKGEPEAPSAPRRDRLPAIDEINSTLRASSGRSRPEVAFQVAAEAEQTERNRFGSGFLTLVLLAVILLALYILAPEIAARVPSLAGVAGAYVAAVDAARIWLDSQIRSLIGMLRGLEGSSKG